MAYKDLTAKSLEAKNDIFAKIFNTLVFSSDETKIMPEYLTDEPTESIYTDYDGNYRNMYRDVCKKYSVPDNNQYLSLVCLGIENQTQIDRNMPIRVLGYTYTNYKKQLDEYMQDKKALLKLRKEAKNEQEKKIFDEKINELGKFKLIPALTLVLNFNKVPWYEAVSLKDLVNDDNPYKKLMTDFNIMVVDVLNLPVSVMRELSCDFGYIMEFLATGAVDKSILLKELKYPVASLDMLIALTNDERYESIKNEMLIKEMEGDVVVMHEFLDKLERNTAIKMARNGIECGISEELIIKQLEKQLNISFEEAKEVFEKEVMQLA